MAVDSTQGYDEEAEVLAARYESLHFAHVHRYSLHLFPAPPSQVLDIGAGSGRDAAALAALGHRVLAVEPTAGLRERGRQLHADTDVEWLDDSLPALAGVLQRGQLFDLVLLTAVWMHLDVAERQVAMTGLARLLAPGGRIVLTLRHGPVPPGRRMFDISFEETDALAREHGLQAMFQHERYDDTQGRPDVHWTILALEALPTG